MPQVTSERDKTHLTAFASSFRILEARNHNLFGGDDVVRLFGLLSVFALISDNRAFVADYGRSIFSGAMVKLETAVEAASWRRASAAASRVPSSFYTDILGAPRTFLYFNNPPATAPSTLASASNLRSSADSDLLFKSSPPSTPSPLPSDQQSPKRYTYTHLPPFIAHQLAVIWAADRRLPTPESRKRWALARDVDPVRVHNWWYRRKKVAKGLGVVIPEGNYELGMGDPAKEKERWEKEREEALLRIERLRQEREEQAKREREEKEARDRQERAAREEEERKEREEAEATEAQARLRAQGKENLKGGKKKTRAPTEDAADSPARKRVKTVQRKDSTMIMRRDSAASARKASLRPPKIATSLRSTHSRTAAAASATATTAPPTKSKVAPPQPRPHMRLTRRNRPEEWQEWVDGDGRSKDEAEDEDALIAEPPAPIECEQENCDDLAASGIVLNPELPALDDDLVPPTCTGFTTNDMSRPVSRDRPHFVCAVCAEPAPPNLLDFDPLLDYAGFSSLGDIDCDTLLSNTDSGMLLADTDPDAFLGEAVLDASLILLNEMLDDPTHCDEITPPGDIVTIADRSLAHANAYGTDTAHNSWSAFDTRSACISLRQSWISGPTISYDLTDADFSAPAFAMNALPLTRLDEAYPPNHAYIHFDGVAYTRDGFRVAPLLAVVDHYASCSPIPMDVSSPASIFSFVSSDPCRLDPATVYPSSPASSRSSSPSSSCRSSPAASRSSSPTPSRLIRPTAIASPVARSAIPSSKSARARILTEFTNTASSMANAPADSSPQSTAPLDFGTVKLHPNLKKSSSSIVSRPLPPAHPSLFSGSLPKCRSLPIRAPLRTIEIIDAVIESPRAMVEPLRDIQAPRPTRPYRGVRRLEAQAMDYQGVSTATPSTLSSTVLSLSSSQAPTTSSSLAPRMSWLLDAAVQALTASR
ncbi:uncharacterized protein SCHCODRAFT_02668745 [Schizophyllum commune H4-8]|nr:uncharacterized protein SCHCODRAFT_02668745 [Schizophyllum commune H4-8]KAI5891388.1 hypothetical protein SCHCODRAFT_02668745 [Schizophyllum commune H4-8]